MEKAEKEVVFNKEGSKYKLDPQLDQQEGIQLINTLLTVSEKVPVNPFTISTICDLLT